MNFFERKNSRFKDRRKTSRSHLDQNYKTEEAFGLAAFNAQDTNTGQCVIEPLNFVK